MKLLLIVALSIPAYTFADNFDNSPNNFNNMPSNIKNSESWFDNSPKNFNNMESNPYSTNGIYTESGERTGYKVDKPSGGSNYLESVEKMRGIRNQNREQKNEVN